MVKASVEFGANPLIISRNEMHGNQTVREYLASRIPSLANEGVNEKGLSLIPYNSSYSAIPR